MSEIRPLGVGLDIKPYATREIVEIGLFDEFTIDGALHDLADGQYIEAGRTQNAHDAKVATFVGEET